MPTMNRNEFLRGAMAAGAASFAESVTGSKPAQLSATLAALAHVQRLVDAASDRLDGALADVASIDPSVVAALRNVKARALAIAGQVDTVLPLG
jgi:hypothetical protein